MPGQRTLQQWDDDTHRDILLALLEQMRPSGADWARIVARLHEKGYKFSEGALTYVWARAAGAGTGSRLPVPLTRIPQDSFSLSPRFPLLHLFSLAPPPPDLVLLRDLTLSPALLTLIVKLHTIKDAYKAHHNVQAAYGVGS
jgi:hypothetical protein